MTEEERQRKMDFILEQQARFEPGNQVAQREIAQIRRLLLTGIRLFRRERTEDRVKLKRLADVQLRIEEVHAAGEAQLNEKFGALINAQIRADEKMNSLKKD